MEEHIALDGDGRLEGMAAKMCKEKKERIGEKDQQIVKIWEMEKE